MHSMRLAASLSSVGLLVRSILFAGAPSEIVKARIAGIAVEMAALVMWARPRPDEGLGDEEMDGASFF
jgi:hypothetical protein